MKSRSVTLGTLAGISGFVLMSFEMTAARVLAPTIGSSTYVWTSVIGVIITALSVGYWYGGRLADKRSRMADCVFILLATALSISLVSFFHRPILSAIATTGWDVRLQGTLASLALFAPTSFLLGVLSPYLARLNIRELNQAGQAVANLSALNAIGGISGTFITGFFLFSLIGSRSIFILLAGMMLLAGWLTARGQIGRRSGAIWLLCSICTLILMALPTHTNALQIDTASAHYTIDTIDTPHGPINTLQTGPKGYQSATNLRHPDVLVLPYVRELAGVPAAAQQRKNILILGGGALSLPGYLASHYPASQIDVVEIDPALPDIARQHFAYKDSPNTTIITEDARTYVNTTKKRYDLLFVDVYSNNAVPPAFVTDEFGQRIQKILTQDGVAVANIVAGSNGDCQRLHDTLVAPYRAHFSAGIFKQESPSTRLSNFTAIFGSTTAITTLGSKLIGYQPYTTAPLPAYTDDFTPIEPIQYICLRT